MTLRDAIDKDFFYIENISYSDDEIKAMSFDELETLKMQITKKITGLSASIKEKQIEYSNGGKSATKSWYMSRRLALSINQRVLTYVSSIIKKRLRESRRISDCFMDQARELLPREEFESILSNAHNEMKMMEGT